MSLLVVGCGRDDRLITVEGNIEGIDVRSVTLFALDVYDSKEIGTQRLNSKGTFSFETESGETSFYYLSADNNDYVVLIASPGEDITISAEGWSLSQSYSVSGSPESELLREYRKGYYTNLNAVAEANRAMVQSRGDDNYAETHAALSQKMEDLFTRQKESAESFIRKNTTSLASLIILNDRFGQKRLFTDEEDFEILEVLDKGLMQSYPGNKHSLEHHQRVEKAREGRMLTIE